jgi:hypothetical protein
MEFGNDIFFYGGGIRPSVTTDGKNTTGEANVGTTALAGGLVR